MIYFHIQTSAGNILASNISQFPRRKELELKSEYSDARNGKGIKSVQVKTDDLQIWFVAQNESELLNSSKLFNKTLSAYVRAATDIWAYQKAQLEAQAHTLTTIQGQLGQEFEGFSDPALFHGETYTDSIEKLARYVGANLESAADLIFYTNKKIADMRAHLLGVEVIHAGGEYEILPSTVSLKRAILNQCSSFLQELERKSVKVRFFFNDEHDVSVDKNMFSLVMYNFFSNAVKYTKPDTEIRLNYDPGQRSLDISMISLKMEKSEIASLSEQGVRGQHAGDFPGKGIGLFVLQRALQLMGKQRMYIMPMYEKTYSDGKTSYIENHFKFML